MKRVIKSVGAPLAFAIAYVFLGPFMFTTCGTTGDYALERLRTCRPAAELLGDNIDFTYGMSCGSHEVQGGLERASVRVPVAGSKARGTYNYSADRVGGSMRFSGAVTVGDESIDVGICREVGE